MKDKISVRNSSSEEDCDSPHAMRFNTWKLLVASTERRYHIFRYLNSAFSLEHIWKNLTGFNAESIEHDENSVVLQDHDQATIHVYLPFGKLLRQIENPSKTYNPAYKNGKLITGNKGRILRVWDVQNGVCLRGHASKVVSIVMHKPNIATSAVGMILAFWLFGIWANCGDTVQIHLLLFPAQFFPEQSSRWQENVVSATFTSAAEETLWLETLRRELELLSSP